MVEVLPSPSETRCWGALISRTRRHFDMTTHSCGCNRPSPRKEFDQLPIRNVLEFLHHGPRELAGDSRMLTLYLQSAAMEDE